jgi:hypothetical protein
MGRQPTLRCPFSGVVAIDRAAAIGSYLELLPGFVTACLVPLLMRGPTIPVDIAGVVPVSRNVGTL